VLFRLTDRSPDNVRRHRDDYYDALSVIESIHDLKVEVTNRQFDEPRAAPLTMVHQFDIVQDSVYATQEDLDSYLVDPRHRAAGSVLTGACELVASADYDFES
jgi:hypothetical protein